MAEALNYSNILHWIFLFLLGQQSTDTNIYHTVM